MSALGRILQWGGSLLQKIAPELEPRPSNPQPRPTELQSWPIEEQETAPDPEPRPSASCKAFGDTLAGYRKAAPEGAAGVVAEGGALQAAESVGGDLRSMRETNHEWLFG